MKGKNSGQKHKTADKLKLVIVVVVSLAIFFALATSTLNNWIKAGSLLVLLAVSGMLIQRLSGIEGYYGLLILRGKKGFKAMEYFSANFSTTAKRLADFGLSLGFGALYSYWLFGKDKKKFLSHVAAMAFLFGSLQFLAGQPFSGWGLVFLLMNLLFGLLALGVQSLVLQGAKILTTADAGPGAALVIPGVTVPWEGIIALIIAAGVHEIAHGILCRVEKLEVKNSGAILLGILPIGAFVEPNEEKMKDMDLHKKRRILVAGTTSNFFVFLFFLLLTQLAAFGIAGMTEQVKIVGVSEKGSAYGILQTNEFIYAVNGVQVKNTAELLAEVKKYDVGETVAFSTNLGTKNVKLAEGKKMGVFLQDAPAPQNAFVFGILAFAFLVFNLTALINFALAVINLMPIFLTDGYRMVYEEARAAFPSQGDRKAKRIAIAAGIVSVLLILINFIPSFR